LLYYLLKYLFFPLLYDFMKCMLNQTLKLVSVSLLLKLSSIGFIRFSLIILCDIMFLPHLFQLFASLVFYLVVCELFFYWVIAYSNIIHMNFSVFGILINSYSGLFSFNINVVIHCLISNFMFYFVCFTTECFGNRLISNINFSIILFPIISFSSFYIFIANVNIPIHIKF